MFSKNRKIAYERARREKIWQERKLHQVLQPWVERKYPGIFMEFTTFFNKLQDKNPQTVPSIPPPFIDFRQTAPFYTSIPMPISIPPMPINPESESVSIQPPMPIPSMPINPESESVSLQLPMPIPPMPINPESESAPMPINPPIPINPESEPHSPERTPGGCKSDSSGSEDCESDSSGSEDCNPYEGIKEHVQDLDVTADIFDWECFEHDIASIECSPQLENYCQFKKNTKNKTSNTVLDKIIILNLQHGFLTLLIPFEPAKMSTYTSCTYVIIDCP